MYPSKLPIENIAKNDVQKIARILLDCKDRGGKVILAGNGGSSAICAHFANDLIKALGIAAINLTDNVPTLTAYSNDINYGVALGEICEVLIRREDVLFLMSTSGQSENILHLAARFKVPAIALIGNRSSPMSKWAKHVLCIFTGGPDARSNEDLFSIIAHATVDYIEKGQR